jgi:hypothetical protein
MTSEYCGKIREVNSVPQLAHDGRKQMNVTVLAGLVAVFVIEVRLKVAEQQVFAHAKTIRNGFHVDWDHDLPERAFAWLKRVLRQIHVVDAPEHSSFSRDLSRHGT